MLRACGVVTKTTGGNKGSVGSGIQAAPSARGIIQSFMKVREIRSLSVQEGYLRLEPAGPRTSDVDIC